MSKSIKHRYLFIPDKIQRSQAKLNTINPKKYKGQNEYQRANNPKSSPRYQVKTKGVTGNQLVTPLVLRFTPNFCSILNLLRYFNTYAVTRKYCFDF